MADFTVLGPDDAPEREIRVPDSVHFELMRLADECGASSFAPFHDYYGDTEVVVEALPKLSQEIRMLRSHAQSPDLLRLLSELDGLVTYALTTRRSLHALAD
jgi:hypothetical protein